MKVLIFGGLGFMGINLVHRLWERGDQVTIFSNVPPREDLKKLGINVSVGDIRNKSEVEWAVTSQDIIFNLAGRSGQVDFLKNPILDLEVNCNGVLNILESVKEKNPEARVIFPGSRLQFGKSKYLPVDEKHPMEPTSIYGLHKLLGEKYHLLFQKIHGLKTFVLRFSNPYGPHQKNGTEAYNFFNLFIDKAMNGETLTVFGEGSQLRDYIYIDDLVDSLIAAAELEDYGEGVLNIGSGEGTKFADMVRVVVEVVGKGAVESIPWPAYFAEVETGDYVTDITKAKKVLGWEPKVGLREGIKKTVDFYQDNQNDDFFRLVI